MSPPRIGRPDLMADLAAGVKHPVDPPSPSRPDPIRQALAPRPPSPDLTAVKPSQRLAALASAAQALAAELEPLPHALDAIAKRVRQRLKPARPEDEALVADLHALRERAFFLSLDIRRLQRTAAGSTDPNASDARTDD